MKYIRYAFMVAFLLFLLIVSCADAFATSTQITTETLSEEKKEYVIEAININLFTQEPSKQAIWCFDVNENGLIAIGGKKANDDKIVCIYTSDGVFQYGYTFEDSGTFGVELSENILTIYFVRGDTAVSVNPEGEVEDVVVIPMTSKNNSRWKDSVFSSEKEALGKTYTLKNDMGFFNNFTHNYSQLVITDNNGTETILYDVNSIQYVKYAFGTCVTFGLVIFGFVYMIKKMRNMVR